MKAPNRLDFTPEEIDALLQRLENKNLMEGDYCLLTDVLRAVIWLSFSLKEKELSIKRLRKIFGIKTESAAKLLGLVRGDPLSSPSKKDSSNDSKDSDQEQDPSKDEKTDKKKTKKSWASTFYTLYRS